jgi:hypothetical protein
MRDTWYVLEDGSSADPADVAPDESGKLMHKSGLAVAMRGQVPSTRGVDPDEERAKARPKPKPTSKDMKSESSKPGYSTRESKSE